MPRRKKDDDTTLVPGQEPVQDPEPEPEPESLFDDPDDELDDDELDGDELDDIEPE